MECFKCKSAVVDATSKCTLCSNVFHKGCARRLSVKPQNEDYDLIICHKHGAQKSPQVTRSDPTEVEMLKANNDELKSRITSLKSVIAELKEERLDFKNILKELSALKDMMCALQKNPNLCREGMTLKIS